MTFNDALKQSIFSNFNTANVSVKEVVIIMGITLLLSLYMFFIYRIICRKNFYDKTFNISLAALAIITAAIIITIQSSIVISLGMVGALSIVRFRTAIKNPLDLVFLFWAIALGIICGTGLYHVAFIITIVLTLLIFVLDMIPVAKVPMILVVQCKQNNLQDKILSIVEDETKYYKVKSRNITNNRLNMVIELKTNQESELLSKVNELEGVDYVSLIDHEGEVTF